MKVLHLTPQLGAIGSYDVLAVFQPATARTSLTIKKLEVGSDSTPLLFELYRATSLPRVLRDLTKNLVDTRGGEAVTNAMIFEPVTYPDAPTLSHWKLIKSTSVLGLPGFSANFAAMNGVVNTVKLIEPDDDLALRPGQGVVLRVTSQLAAAQPRITLTF